MARLIDTDAFDGAQWEGAALRVWSKTADGRRTSELFDGDEAQEAAIEIRDLLGGMSDPGASPGGGKEETKGRMR